MATATFFALTGKETLATSIKPLRLDSAKKASDILNENHHKYDIYINNLGHHVRNTPFIFSLTLFKSLAETSTQNHILHHVPTLYALGASPDEIQRAYDAQAIN